MSGTLFVNLKSFCSNIEEDAKKLRRIVDSGGKNHSEGIYYPSDAYAVSLRQRVQLLDSTLQTIENSVLGNAESRLRQISVTEISEKISSLVEANERQLRSLEDVVVLSSSSQGDYDGLVDTRRYQRELTTESTHTHTDRRIVASTPQPHSSDTKKVLLLSRGGGFSAEKVGPLPESDTDLRPSAPRALSASNEEGEEGRVLTPTMAAWKLTKATQNLFQDPDHNNAVSAGLLTTAKKHHNAATGSKIPTAIRNQRRDFHQSSLHGNEEGDGGNAAGYSTGVKPQQQIGNQETPPLFRTPDIDGVTLAAAGQNDLYLSPATPITPVTPSVGTPFHVFKLVSAAGGRKKITSPLPAASAAVHSASSSRAVADGTAIYDANKTSDRPYPPKSEFSSSLAEYATRSQLSSSVGSVSASTPQPIRSKAADLAALASAPTPPSPFREVVESGRSPLLMSKLLAPQIRSRGSAAVSAAEVVDIRRNSAASFIPLVADKEWQTNAPSFLKMQLSSADLNSVLRVVNDHLVYAGTNRSSRSGVGGWDHHAENAGSDVLLRLEEVESLVTSAGVPLAVDIKIVLLGLVHMKRMDIAASTHGVKVYKIKRI